MPRIDLSLCHHATGLGFDEDNREIPTCDPDYGLEIDEQADTPFSLAADMLSRLLAEFIPESGPIRLDLLGQKILALHFLLNRNGTATLTSLAGRAGISKQLLDYTTNKIADQFNFHGFGQKTAKSRASYSAAARASWAALTPEQRRSRRRGKAAQQATHAANLTTHASLNETAIHHAE
jgi:hypothetical protein